ncbi:alpha/beta fold hydrolase [Devosia sp.]|uniref:alpha/beta hydrolase n=1 Tax=Devosia sp. TaxID=1871048 RepID=UPI0025F54EDF|nr:alpha/beta fold hydrolase [Devosia sp.]MCR6636093.1 alpha/beta fold hydrolase [Devosia sp.]
MSDYTRNLPAADICHLGPNDLFVELHRGKRSADEHSNRPPLLFVHGAFTGSWMWAKYIPHFIAHGSDAFYLNLRGHYKSRSVDLSRVVFADYLADIELAIDTIIDGYQVAPILVGFSMGGLLSLKTAESTSLSGLVLIDSSIPSQVHTMAPYAHPPAPITGLVVPAPLRPENSSLDETLEDIAFQRKYLSLEAANVFRNLARPYGETGISVAGENITCPSLVISAISHPDDDLRGQALALHTRSEYFGLPGTTHTGLLVGQRYGEVVTRILAWLDSRPT